MPSVGELKVTLTADISELREALRQGNNLLDSVSNSMKEVKGAVSSGVADISGSITNLSTVVNGVSGAFNGVSGEVGTSMGSISKSAKQMSSSLQSSMTEANASLDSINSTLDSVSRKISAQTGSITKSFRKLGAGIDDSLSIVNNDIARGFTGMDASLGRFDKSFKQVSMDVRTYSEGMKTSIEDLGRSIVGANKKVGNLTKISNQLKSVISKMSEFQNVMADGDKFDNTAIGKKMTLMLDVLAKGFTNLGMQARKTGQIMEEAFDKASRSSSRARSGLMGTAFTLRQLALDFFILRMHTNYIAGALASWVKPGVEFGATMENTRLGMAGILTSMTQINGQQTTFAQATGVADNLMQKIADNALLTTVTTGELLETFQALLAPGLSAKMTLEEIVDIATVGANAVKSIGLPSNQVVQEMRDLIMGGIRPQSSTLAASLGITDADVKRWREAGTLYAELRERMKGFKQASEETQNTFNGLWSNIQDGIQRSQSTAFDPFFKHLKTELKQVQSLFYDINKVQVKRKDKDGNETTEMKSVAVMNNKTIAFFSKLAEMGVRIVNIFKNVFQSFVPVLLPLFEVLGTLIKLLDIVVGAFHPLAMVLSYTLGAVISLVDDGLKLLIENLDIVVIALSLYTAFLIVNNSALIASTIATKVSIVTEAIHSAILAVKKGILIAVTVATIAYTSAVGGLSKAYAVLSAFMSVAMVKMILIAGAILAVIGVITLLYYAFDETSLAFKAGLEYMSLGVESFKNQAKIYFTEFILYFNKMVKDMKETWNDSPFGKTLGKFDIGVETQGIELVQGALDVLTGKQDELDAQMAGAKQTFNVNSDLAIRKTKDSISKIYQDFMGKLIPDMPDVKGKPKDETESGKGANKIANAKEKLEMEEIEARRKAYIEDIKKYIKERDIAYEQGEISLREHIDFTYQAERQIAIIEEQALEEKLAVQQARIAEAEAMGNLEEVYKNQADAIKILSEIRSKQLSIQTLELEYKNKLINADKETLRNLYETTIAYKELVGGASEYQNALAGIAYQDKLKALNSTIADKKGRNEDTTLAEEAKRALIAKQEYDNKLNSLNDYKGEYDRVMADIEATEAEYALKVKQGTMTGTEAQEKSIALRKEANAELQTTVDKLEALMATTDNPVVLNNLRKLIAEIQGVGTELGTVAQQMKTTLESGFTTAFTGIIDGTKKVSDAFNDMAQSILTDMAKILSKGFAESLVGGMNLGGMFGGGNKPKQGGTTGLNVGGESERSGNEVKGGIEKSLLTAGNSLKIFGKTTEQTNTSLMQGLNLGQEGNLLDKLGIGITQDENMKNMTLSSTLEFLRESAIKAAIALSMVSSSSGSGAGSFKLFASTGGFVSGKGTATSDDIDARLSNGEYVINSAVVKKFGKGFFDKVNDGHLPTARFATGGYVSGNANSSSQSSGTNNGQQVPNIKIDIINQSGTAMDAKMGQPSFDGKQWVMQMFLSGLSTNTMGSKDILKGMK